MRLFFYILSDWFDLWYYFHFDQSAGSSQGLKLIGSIGAPIILWEQSAPWPLALASSDSLFSFINCREQICCGVIFKGQRGEVLVDPRLMKPCWCKCSANTTPRNPYANPIPPSPSTTDHAPHKREARQDSLGSEGSLEISEADDLEDSAMEDDHHDSVKQVMHTIMEGVEGHSKVIGQDRSEVTVQ